VARMREKEEMREVLKKEEIEEKEQNGESQP
jgi:hypothetical protein